MVRQTLQSVFAWIAIAPLSAAFAAGFISEQNFVIVVPPDPTQQAAQVFAERVSLRAEDYRRQIATAWLGEPLPDGIGRTVIHLDFHERKDVGLTWAKDDPGRSFHNVYLQTSRDRALGSTLAHEIVHVVLATDCPAPNRLAPWVEEGIASQYDDEERFKEREQLLRWFAKTQNWPDLKTIMQSKAISRNDREAYAVAAVLTEMLVKRNGRAVFIAFARDARKLGWDPALREHYRIDGIAELQSAWQMNVGDGQHEPAHRLAFADRRNQ